MDEADPSSYDAQVRSAPPSSGIGCHSVAEPSEATEAPPEQEPAAPEPLADFDQDEVDHHDGTWVPL